MKAKVRLSGGCGGRVQCVGALVGLCVGLCVLRALIAQVAVIAVIAVAAVTRTWGCCGGQRQRRGCICILRLAGRHQPAVAVGGRRDRGVGRSLAIVAAVVAKNLFGAPKARREVWHGCTVAWRIKSCDGSTRCCDSSQSFAQGFATAKGVEEPWEQSAAAADDVGRVAFG